MSVARRAFSGTVAGMASLVAHLVVQLVSVPVFLRSWGDETYGIWLAANSLFTLLITLDQGHQNYIGAQLLTTVGIDDAEALRTTQSGVAGAAVLATLETTIAAVLYATGTLGTAAAAPPARAPEVAVAVGILLLSWAASGSVSCVLVRLYTPLGLYARATWIGLAHRVSMAASAMATAACGGGLVHAAVAVATVSTAWTTLIFIDLSRFRLYRPFWNIRVDLRRVRANLSGSLVLTGASVVAQAQQHVVLFILGSTTLGVGAIAVFATTRTLANLFLQGASTFVAPLTPDLVRAHVEGQPGRLATLIVVLTGIGASVTALGIAALLPFVTPLYVAWIGEALHFDRTLFALLAASVVVRTAASPLLTLLTATNSLRAQLTGATIQTIVTLTCAAALAPHDGIRGVCLGILLGELAASLFVYPWFVLRLRPDVLSHAPRRSSVFVAVGTICSVLVLLTRAYTDLPDIALATALAIAGTIASAATLHALPANVRARLVAVLPWKRTA